VALVSQENYPIHERKSKASRGYPAFDRKSDESVVIGLIPGSGPQSNAGFGIVPAVGMLFKGTDFWCLGAVLRLPETPDGDPPVLVLAAILSSGSAKGVENKPPLSPLEARLVLSFCGVSNARRAGLACTTSVLRSGSVRTARRASLRRCAACSAFSAAAVALATCGVTSSVRRTSSRSRARGGVLNGLSLSRFSFAIRVESADTSAVC
jgi:hypothetical protein